MPPAREPRKGREIRRRNFKLLDEARRVIEEAIKGPEEHEVIALADMTRESLKVHPRAFGTTKRVEYTTYLGKITRTKKTKVSGNGRKSETYWHVDRRKKKGTVKDRGAAEIPKRRQRKEEFRTNFSLNDELMRVAVEKARSSGEGGGVIIEDGGRAHVTYPKAFGTTRRVRNAKLIGAIETEEGVTYWHVPRRKEDKEREK